MVQSALAFITREPDTRLPGNTNDIENRVIRQRDALLELTAEQLTDCDALPDALRRILEVSAQTLGVERVSIWRYNDQRTAIDCLDLFTTGAGRHTRGSSLRASDFPQYFRAIAKSEIVAVNDAQRDPRTAEFTVPYLRPLGITSMMDVPIHLRGAVIGVLCHEHTGAERHWSVDEKAFAIAVSNLISRTFERCEQQRAESTLMLQSAALNAAADAICITDQAGAIVWVNPSFTTLTGYSAEDVLGKNPRELLRSGVQDDVFYQEMWTTLLDGRVWRGELVNRRKDGTTYLEDQSITPVMAPGGGITHFVAIKRDLTERRNLEGQFLQAQKMEVVGRLAGGIAHDFNNLLTVINGSAELALADLAANHPLRIDFERIQESGKRAAALTRQLLSFSRKQTVVRGPVVIGRVLTDFRGMLQRLIGEDIHLDVRAGTGATVLADQGQLEQVILNLAVNARDAMPRGGSLRLGVHDVDLDTDFAAHHAGVEPGPYVRLAVTDTGEGMDADTVTRIFEPFFTTKEAGKGTGLGLATVYAIVEQAGGTIWVESELGKGTTFTIYLPRVTDGEVTPEPAVERAITGTETIIVVEGDESVRELTSHIIRSAGYEVFAARDAAAALKLLEEQKDSIDLIVDRRRAANPPPPSGVVHVGLHGRHRSRRRRARSTSLFHRQALHRDGAGQQGARGPAPVTLHRKGPVMSATAVIAAIDLGPSSGRVLYHAAGFARLLGAQLKIVHVSADVSADVHQQVLDYCLQNGPYEADLDERNIVVRGGRVSETIQREAHKEQAALIVMGSRGHGGLAKMLLGSTCEAVLRSATAPVLLVPPTNMDIVNLSDRAALTCGAVLAAVDLTEDCPHQLRMASEMAALSGQPLLLMTVAKARLSDHQAGVMLRQRGHGLEPVKPRAMIVRRGNVVDEISQCALTEGAGLVVMGLRSKPRCQPGVIASGVLKTKRAFVLAVPGC